MALWYVRLRRAAKHRIYHTDLLKAERLAGPCSKIRDPVAAIKNSNLTLDDVNEIKESRANAEEDSLTESEDSQDDEDGDFDEFYRKEAAKFRSAQAKREFFSGMRF